MGPGFTRSWNVLMIASLFIFRIESNQRQLTSNWDIKEVVMRRIIPHETEKQVEYYFAFNDSLTSKINMLKAKQESYPIADHHIHGKCYFFADFIIFMGSTHVQDRFATKFELKPAKPWMLARQRMYSWSSTGRMVELSFISWTLEWKMISNATRSQKSL